MLGTLLAGVLFCSIACASPVSSNSQDAGQRSNETKAPPITFTMDPHGNYSYTQGEKLWLQGAPAFLHTDGQQYTSLNGSLKQIETFKEEGRDKIGQWTSTCFLYLAGSRHFQTCAKSWTNPQLPITIFQQRFVNGTSKSSTGTENVISGFPSFQIPPNETDLAYLSFQGGMFGSHTRTGRWASGHVTLSGGVMGGPLSLFDRNGSVMIISPFSGFMSASRAADAHFHVSWGVMGGVDAVPSGYQYETIVYFGYEGINQVFAEWGRFMRRYYGKGDNYREADLTLNYIGYWTDGGAYYYYHTDSNKTYEQTIFDIKSYADSARLPYRYIQYDSWFYPKGPKEGVLTWTPMPEIAPNGFQFIFNKTQLPVGAHNRFWSSQTPYAQQNGGNFTFIVEREKSIPQDLAFWVYLFKEARTWGLILYEQDWLDHEFSGLNAALRTVDVARTWLMQMGEAARAVGLTIQYCMANPRHALQSLEIPVVTQARVSEDYRAGGEQWIIGVSSIFAYAMGIAPFKDTFWTGEHQPDGRYALTEPHGELQAAVATLSTGPVGPGDKIGHTEVAMLMQCCRVDGKILHPDKPATAIDKQIWQSAWPGSGPAGQVWSTHSRISASDIFGIILAAEMKNNYTVTPDDAGFHSFDPRVVMKRPRATQSVPELSPFSDEWPIHISTACGRQQFCLYYTSPLYRVGADQVVIYGEEGKFVPMSRDRVLNIDVLSDSIELVLEGTTGEAVSLGYFWNKLYCRAHIVIGPEGKSVARLTSAGCTGH